MALKSSLSLKLKQGTLKVIDGLRLSSIKTKEFLSFYKNFDPNFSEKALFVFSDENGRIDIATRNLENIEAIHYSSINSYDFLKSKMLYISKEALAKIEEVWADVR